MIGYTCKKCNSRVGIDSSGQFLECKGCGTRINDKLQAVETSYSDSMTCPNCSADLRKNLSEELFICDYCGSIFTNEDYFGKLNRKYLKIFTFSNATDETVRDRFHNAIGKKIGASGDFKDKLTIKGIKNIYLPIYTFFSEIDGSYSLEVGIERKRYYRDSDGKQKTETYIEWEPREGVLRDSFYVEAKGFTYDSISFDDGYKITSSKSINCIHKFCEKIMSGKYKFDNEKDFSSILLDKYDVAPLIESISAYKAEGAKKFVDEVHRSVERKYPGRTRYIHTDYVTTDSSNWCKLYPVSLVHYDYDDKSDLITIMDGVSGTYVEGPILLSAKKVFTALVKILGPALLIAVPAIMSSNGSFDFAAGLGNISLLAGVAGAVAMWINELLEMNEKGFFKDKKLKTIGYSSISSIVMILIIIASLLNKKNLTNYYENKNSAKNSTTTVEKSVEDTKEEISKTSETSNDTEVEDKSKANEINKDHEQLAMFSGIWYSEDGGTLEVNDDNGEWHFLSNQGEEWWESSKTAVYSDGADFYVDWYEGTTMIQAYIEANTMKIKYIVTTPEENYEYMIHYDRDKSKAESPEVDNNHEYLRRYEGTWKTSDGWELWVRDEVDGWYFAQDHGDGWYETELQSLSGGVAFFQRDFDDGFMQVIMESTGDEKMKVTIRTMYDSNITENTYEYTR